MNVVWECPPASVLDVYERVEPQTGWAYTTVKTILCRLVDKGALKAGKRANASLFEPLITQKEAQRSAVRRLIDRVFSGTFGSLVLHLMNEEKLSKTDRKKLLHMLAELDQEQR